MQVAEVSLLPQTKSKTKWTLDSNDAPSPKFLDLSTHLVPLYLRGLVR